MEKISQKEFHSIKRLSKNYIGLTAEKTINVVSCNTGKEVFVSDKLSNMSQSIYNQETKKLLVLLKLVDCLEKCLIYGHIRRFAD